MKRYLFSILVALVFFQSLNAQTYYFEQYSVEEGLPVSKIYYILQDQQGFLWMGTETGVARFDGIRITEFSEEDGVAPRPVRAIMQDASGKIWMGHEGGGLTLYKDGKFSVLGTDSLGVTNDITAIIEDGEGLIWITTYGSGALRIENEDFATAKLIKGAEGLSDRVIGGMVLKSGKVLFITDAGLKTIASNGIENFDIPKLPPFYPVTALAQDQEETLWIGTHNGGLYYWNQEKDTFGYFDEVKGLANNWVSTLTCDLNGGVWAGSWGGGITRVKDGKPKIFNYKNGIKDRKIRHLATDREGNVMIGTNESGLYVFKGEQFVSYTENDGLTNSQVWAICEDGDGRMWFGTNNGITVVPKEGQNGRIVNYHVENVLNANNVRFIVRDNDHNLWVAMWGGGIQKYVAATGKFVNDPIVNSEISLSGNISAFELFDDQMWIGTVEGLIHYDLQAKKIERFTQLDGLPHNDISVVFQNNEREVWVGTRGKGLAKFDVSSRTFQIIDLGENISPQTITQDKNGVVYIGTKSNGIFCVQADKVVKTFTKNDGLLGNYIALLAADVNNNLWVGTNRGLNKIEPEKSRIFTYPDKIGFTGIEAKINAVFTDSDQNIWFGTVNGAIRNNLLREKHNELPPLINISGLSVNGETRSLSDNLELNPDESTIRIDFTGICFTNADDLRYQVKLEGASDEWEDVGNQNYISYPLLRPGSYEFFVKAANNEGVWNEEAASFKFVILPPWYLTKTFFAIAALLLVLGVFSFIKIRERNLLRVNRILEEKVEQRTKEVVAQTKEIDKQKGEIERLLLNILPKNISEELRQKGKATAGHYDMVSVLFTDFKGFTGISERLTPDDLVKELDECFIGFDDIIDDHYIEKIKTIGDAYMCAGGVPIRNKSNPIDVVMAGIRIREFMHELGKKKSKAGEPYWEIRIGIHTGPLIAGVVGKRKFAYDIWGDTVNTASRMESSGEAGKVNISGTTYEIVKDYFDCTYRGKIPAKNKGEIDMYFVNRIKPEFSANPEGTLANEQFRQALSKIV
jgi:ligand-binding sensor domain-containing protein/class 3 adenylate cyclase